MLAILLKILVKEPLRISDHFQSPGWFPFFFFICEVVLDACFSAAVKVLTTELHVVFRDIPILGCVSTVLGELLSLRCWSHLSFCQEILELILVLCLPVE